MPRAYCWKENAYDTAECTWWYIMCMHKNIWKMFSEMLPILISRCSTIQVFPPFLYMFCMLEFPTMNTYYLHRETKETIQNWQRSADRLLVGLILDLQLPSAMLSALSICPCAWVSEVQGNESVIVPSSPGMLCSPLPRALLHVCFDIYFFLPQECIQVSPMLLELSLDIWLGPREAEKYIIPAL